MGQIFAAADIGSNTVHLLIADVGLPAFRRIRNESEWLSLGEIVSLQNEVPPRLADRLVSVIRSYRDLAASHRAQAFYVFATEAMRLAKNHEQVLSRIQHQLGVRVDLITPQREAELSLRGTSLDTAGPSPAVLVEVGGGSVQVALCQNGSVVEDRSLPIGTGKLIAATRLTYPCTRTQLEHLGAMVKDAVGHCAGMEPAVRMVASGGVARGLLRVLHPDGDPVLAVPEIEYVRWAAARLSQEQIVRRFSVKGKRAATLVPGAIVYLELMNVLGHPYVSVSEYGVREGAVLEMVERRGDSR